MMRSFYLKLFVVVAVILAVSFAVFTGIFRKSETPVIQAPIEEKKIPWPESRTIGFSVEKRPILSYKYGKGENHIVFVGGIHGGYEWNSVILAYLLTDYLDENQAIIPQNLTITVIPSLNPDGVYKVVGKEGRFTIADVSVDKQILASGRFNANKVDLNRNFDCRWSPTGMWQSRIVSAGEAPFSEPESLAIKNFTIENSPDAFVFWHSQANAVYGSECGEATLPETLDILNAYSKASLYPTAKTFDGYQVTGDATDWLASQSIPAISIELKTHEAIEWEKNLAGIKALFDYYSKKN